MQSAWKVGLFVLVFGVLFYFGYSLVGNSLTSKPTDTYYAVFDDAGGLTAGTVVSMAGVRIGKVTKVSLENAKQAKMVLAIDKGTFVPMDSQLRVPSSLFSLGDAKLEVVSAKGNAAGKLPPGSTIPGLKGSVLSSMLPEGEATIKELNQTLKATRDLLGDPALRDGLKKVLASTDRTIQTLDRVANNVGTLVAQNQGTIHQALNNAAGAVNDLRAGIKRVTAEIGSKEVTAQVKEMLASLNATAKHAEELVKQVSAFASDPNMKTSLTNTMANMETMSRNGVEISENTKAMTSDGKVITSKAIDLADDAKEIAAQAKELLAKLNEFVGRLPGSTKLARPGLEIETGRNFDTNLLQTNAFLTYPLTATESVYIGVNDLTERNFLTAQYMQRHRNSNLRYGVYSSKAGVGVDWLPAPKLSFSADLFDPNDLTLNLRARYFIGNDLYGWFGLDKAFDRNQAILGIGIKR